MQSTTIYYQAETDFRREQVAREFRGLRARRAARTVARKRDARRTDAA